MTDVITQPELEALTNKELHAKFYQLFNALSRKQQVMNECAQLQSSLQKIQMELHLRKIKPR